MKMKSSNPKKAMLNVDPVLTSEFETACHELYANLIKPAVRYSSERIIKEQFGENAVKSISTWKKFYEDTFLA